MKAAKICSFALMEVEATEAATRDIDNINSIVMKIKPNRSVMNLTSSLL